MKRVTLIALFLCTFKVYGQQNIKIVEKYNYEFYQFDSIADFRRVQFDSTANFSIAKFYSKAIFLYSNFNSTAEFSGVNFNSTADFLDLQFHSEAYFFNAKFGSTADFSGTQFKSKVDFFETRFSSIVYFLDTKFNSQAIFFNTKFDSTAHFHGVQFDSLAYFRDARFNHLTIFSGVHFKDKADFTSVILPDFLDFREIKSAEIVDLTKTKLDSAKAANGQKCYIDLRDSPIEKFRLTYDNFRVWKPDTIPDRLNFQKLTEVYEKLLKNFKDNGYTSSYETLDKEYQAFKDLQNPDASISKRLFNRVNYYWSNYGYNKEWIWFWTTLFLAVFTLFNWLFFPYLIKKVYAIDRIKEACPKKLLKSKKQLNFRRIDLAFLYTAFIFFGFKMSPEQINFKNTRSVTFILFQYIIGLICVGYLINFIISSGLIGG
ncbi:MAG: pentapeptide repeat-containing protein [Bacteroidota bacterium]